MREGREVYTQYSITLETKGAKTVLAITANDAGHAQAQAKDIARALKADRFELHYEEAKETSLSRLFKKLAYNEFEHKTCELWDQGLVNGVPVAYLMNNRFYVRPIVLDYLDITREEVVSPLCGNKLCVNPYHNKYKATKASKLSGADMNLALVFSSQGVPVKEIAKVLKVHRSTIYRILKK
jgi:hypothetical protein